MRTNKTLRRQWRVGVKKEVYVPVPTQKTMFERLNSFMENQAKPKPEKLFLTRSQQRKLEDWLVAHKKEIANGSYSMTDDASALPAIDK